MHPRLKRFVFLGLGVATSEKTGEFIQVSLIVGQSKTIFVTATFHRADLSQSEVTNRHRSRMVDLDVCPRYHMP